MDYNTDQLQSWLPAPKSYPPRKFTEICPQLFQFADDSHEVVGRVTQNGTSVATERGFHHVRTSTRQEHFKAVGKWAWLQSVFVDVVSITIHVFCYVYLLYL